MKVIWQNDPKWRALTFGPNNLPMGKYGCLVSSFCMILDMEPPEFLLRTKGCFNEDGLICSAAAKVLGLKYEYRGGRVPVKNAIWETDHFAQLGFPKHFVACLGDWKIADPYDGRIKNNQYRIVSTRIFTK